MTALQPTDAGLAALKPCPNPWCEANEREGDFRPQVQYSNFGLVFVACTSCTMAGPTRNHEAEAIAAWNHRPSPTTGGAGLADSALSISYTPGLRDLAAMPHVSLDVGNVLRDCADVIDNLRQPAPRADDALREAAQAFVDKLGECQSAINSAFYMAYDRMGESYRGPQYGQELEALRAALAASEEPKRAEGEG